MKVALFVVALVISASVILSVDNAYKNQEQLIKLTIKYIDMAQKTGNAFYLFKAETTWKDVRKNMNYVTSVLVAMEKTGVNASGMQSLFRRLDEQKRQDSLWNFLVREM